MQFKFTPKIKFSLIAVAVILCLVSAYFLFLGTKIKQLMALNSQLQAMEVSFAKIKKDESYVPKLERDIFDNKRKIDLIQKRIPTDINIAELIQNLAQIGSRLGIKEYGSIIPGEVNGIDKYIIAPVKVTFNCSYPQLIEYLKELEKMPRLSRVDGIRIRVNELDPEELSIEISLTALSMIETVKK